MDCGEEIETGTGSDRQKRSQRGKGGIIREGKGRKKETVTDSKGEKPVLVSCASTAEVRK